MRGEHTLIRIALLCIAALMYGNVHVHAERPKFELVLDAEDNTVAYANGLMDTPSYEHVRRFLNRNRQVQFLVLEQVPGTIDTRATHKICRLIYNRKISTVLLKDSVVQSGGSTLFACGRTLILHPDSQIGVHSWGWSDDHIAAEAGVEIPRAFSSAHQDFIFPLYAVDISEDFYWFYIQAAPFSSMHFMTAEEIEQYFGHKLEEGTWDENKERVKQVTVAVDVGSKYGGLFDPAAAHAPSGVGDLTVIESRDLGIDLFIAGMALNFISPFVINSAGVSVLGLDTPTGAGTSTGGVSTTTFAGAAAFAGAIVLAGTAGLVMWITGAVFWGRGNNMLQNGAIAVTDPRNDYLLSLEGTQLVFSY